jgi:hypothetical protein
MFVTGHGLMILIINGVGIYPQVTLTNQICSICGRLSRPLFHPVSRSQPGLMST